MPTACTFGLAVKPSICRVRTRIQTFSLGRKDEHNTTPTCNPARLFHAAGCRGVHAGCCCHESTCQSANKSATQLMASSLSARGTPCSPHRHLHAHQVRAAHFLPKEPCGASSFMSPSRSLKMPALLASPALPTAASASAPCVSAPFAAALLSLAGSAPQQDG